MAMMENQVQEFEREGLDLRFYFWIIYRRWYLIVGAVAFSLFVAAAYLRVSPRIYEAKSLVRIRKQIPTMLFVQPIPQMMLREGELVNLKTAQRLILTRLTAEEALRLMREIKGGEKDRHSRVPSPLPLNHLTPEELLNRVRVKGLDPDLVEIAARHEDPKLAAFIANSFAQAFVDRIARESRLEASNERRFIQSLLDQVEEQLKGLEGEIASVKKEMGVVDIEAETGMVMKALQDIEGNLRDVEAELRAVSREIKQIRKLAAKETPLLTVQVMRENPVITALKEQLATLELQRARWLARYFPSHPLVQRVEEQIKAVRESLTRGLHRFVKEPEVAPNPLYALMRERLLEAEAKRLMAEARWEALTRFREELRKRLENLPDQQRRLGELLRKREILEQTYTALLMRLQDAQIREAAKRTGAVIADLADIPSVPVLPRTRLTLALAFLLGLMVGAIAAFFAEFLNTAVETPEEIKQIVGLPTLAVIPQTQIPLTQEQVLDLMNSRRASSEAIRTLRSNLKFLATEKRWQSLLITSPMPGEGKTFVATALAISFAQAGQKVILVDADLRHPGIHHRLGLKNDKGLTTVLLGKTPLEEALTPTSFQNLQALLSGPLPPNPAELLDTPAMRDLLNELRERADTIILDSPPVLAVTDPTVLAPSMDGILLVIEAGTTPREALMKVREQIDLARGHLFGVVLNKVTGKTGRGYYYYRYRYYGYHYYRYYGEA